MKLLFDQNLSFKLCTQLAHEFPDSNQVRLLALDAADDRTIWEHAKANGFTLVTQDSDFADMAALFGPPPKVIWLRCGNQPTSVVANLLRTQADALRKFEQDTVAACWEIY
jgi:predicted nuclease of predicted toxin-antitoxin system